MGYTFAFKDEESQGSLAAKLNDVCRNTAKSWRDAARASPLSDARDLILLLVDETDGAELFYFVTPPADKQKMLRRLCAALRIVAETIAHSEELVDAYLHAKDLYKSTVWSAHSFNAGGTNKDINEGLIIDVISALNSVRETVLTSLSLPTSFSATVEIPSDCIGRVIGKQRAKVQELEQVTNCTIFVPNVTPCVAEITGPTAEACEMAVAEIDAIIYRFHFR